MKPGAVERMSCACKINYTKGAQFGIVGIRDRVLECYPPSKKTWKRRVEVRYRVCVLWGGGGYRDV